MSQNQPMEFQIPNGIHHPDSQELIRDEVKDMYSDIYESKEQENSINADIEKLFFIGDEIAAARKHKLDTQFFTYEDHTSGFVRAVAKKLLNPDFFERQRQLKPLTINDLMKRESQIGAEIFGNQPNGNHVQFFNENRNHWYLYQESEKKSGVIETSTIHYEIEQNGILKICDQTGVKGEYITGEEYENFMIATNAYRDQVINRIYSKNDSSSSKIAA